MLFLFFLHFMLIAENQLILQKIKRQEYFPLTYARLAENAVDCM